MNRVAASLAMAVGLFAGSASAELPANALDMSGITDMTTLPTEGLKIIATDRGMIAVTSNGRWVIKGTVYDTWQMRAVRSVADVRESANKIDLERLKVDIDGLEPLYVGTPGKPEVVAQAEEYRAIFGTGTKGALALYRHDHDHDHDASCSHTTEEHSQ